MMKFKKFLSFAALMSAVIFSAVLLGGCDNKDEGVSQMNDSTIASNSTIVEESATEEATEKDVNAVDYSQEDIYNWTYFFDTDDETLKMLMHIDGTEYGTAGSGLKKTVSEIYMLRLSAEPQRSLNKLDEYLDEMNATQADFFSFQWQTIYKGALAMLEAPEDYSELLEVAGVGDIVIADYDRDSLEALNSSVAEKLAERGVADEWKNNLSLEPFYIYLYSE